jgi:hypothetical protein
LSGQSRNDGVFGEAAAGSDGGAASAGEIVAIGAEDAFDDAEMAQTPNPGTAIIEDARNVVTATIRG